MGAEHSLGVKVSDIKESLILGPEGVERVIRKYDPGMNFLVSTDKNLYLEYATPKGNAVRGNTVPLILDELSKSGF
ncbi:hypothetical protein FQZ97_1211220 [compost metagenome]